MKTYRYPWPASAIGAEEMELLYHAREGGEDRPPITRLIRDAVRSCYGDGLAGHSEGKPAGGARRAAYAPERPAAEGGEAA